MSEDKGTILADISAALEIPENGTLSRVLFKDERLRLVGFAFDQGQELTDHTAGVPATIQVVTGRFALTLGDDQQEIGPNSWVHIPAGLTHALRALEPSVMVLTLLRGSS